MSFVSPRKLSRISNYDLVLRDLVCAESNLLEFGSVLDLPEETIQDLQDLAKVHGVTSLEGFVCAPRDHLSTLEEFCEYAVRVIHDNADQVFSLFQQEMNRYTE